MSLEKVPTGSNPSKDGRVVFDLQSGLLLVVNCTCFGVAFGTGVTQAMEEDASSLTTFPCSRSTFNEGTAIGERGPRLELVRSVASSSLEAAMGMMRNRRFLKGSEVFDDDSETSDRDLRFLKGREMEVKIPGEIEASLWVSFAVMGDCRCSCNEGAGATSLVMMVEKERNACSLESSDSSVLVRLVPKETDVGNRKHSKVLDAMIAIGLVLVVFLFLFWLFPWQSMKKGISREQKEPDLLDIFR